MAGRFLPGRRTRELTAEVARVRARLDTSRERSKRLAGRLERTKAALAEARAEARTSRAELKRAERRLAALDSDLGNVHVTLKHYMQLDKDHTARLAEGRAALFDYPVTPRPRTFGRPGKDFFGELMAASDARVADLLREMGPTLAPLAALSEDEVDPLLPFWSNPWLPPLDAVTLYGLIASKRPSLYMEVGSGFSTKYARLAIRDHGLDTRIVSIDPQPRAEIDELCDEVVRSPYEDIDLDLLDRLGPGDVLFVDNSHRSFTNSDVTVFFTESLPYLRPGVIYGLHDTFIPHDYPAEWSDRFYAEQYLLMSYLAGGASGDEVLLGTHHLGTSPHLLEHLTPFLPPIDAPLVGGGFWLTRT
ncbi:class I SAM-dependent methyltransferase [Nocardioides sp.]|uniref:class I SAM-dependent methyltransferase n=1 Tax=Nocardioides sp. TaxID=35761 RepID=UPI0035ADB14D